MIAHYFKNSWQDKSQGQVAAAGIEPQLPSTEPVAEEVGEVDCLSGSLGDLEMASFTPPLIEFVLQLLHTLGCLVMLALGFQHMLLLVDPRLWPGQGLVP